MKKLCGLVATLLLLGLAGCEVEAPAPYGGGYGVYGEYGYPYSGGTYAYPYYYHGYYHGHPYDRDHYWDRHAHFEQHRWHGNSGWGRRDHHD